MSKKLPALVKPLFSVEPLFSDLDRRELIPLAEVAKKTGIPEDQIRIHAQRGRIPGARQVAPGTAWFFKRRELEKWWQEFNAPRAEEIK